MISQKSQSKFSLNLLSGKGKTGTFKYTPLIGPDIISGILVKATGQPVLDFAQKNLFTPLGITVEKNVTFDSKEEQLAFYKATDVSGWVADPMGVNAAGWGLTLSPVDIANIGQLYLDGGIYNEKQFVSKRWVDESTKEYSKWEKNNLSYGYLWWIIYEKEHSFAALGDGGNAIYVNPKNKMVVSISSLFVLGTKDIIELIKNVIEPIFEV